MAQPRDPSIRTPMQIAFQAIAICAKPADRYDKNGSEPHRYPEAKALCERAIRLLDDWRESTA